jgi:hypothetical protein
VRAVEPSRRAVGRDVPVAILGSGFYARAVQPLGAGATEVDDRFRAWLMPADGSAGGTELFQVSRAGETQLSAVVPAGLPAGIYGVAVEGPLGGASLAAAYTATDRPSASLAAEMSVPAPLLVGRPFEAALQVQNSGDGAAAALAPSDAPQVTPSGALELRTSPAAQDIAAQTSGTFGFSFIPRAVGPVRLGLAVAGHDATSGEAVSASAEANLAVSSAAALGAVATLDSPTAAVGGEASIHLALTNAGDLAALGVSVAVVPSDPALAVLTGSDAPASFEVKAGESQEFAFRFRAQKAGALNFGFEASGQEAGSLAPVSAQARTGLLAIGSTPEALTAELAAPFVAMPGRSFDVTLTVFNTAGLGQIMVQPAGDPALAGSGSARLETRPDAAAVPLPPRGACQWTWGYRAQGPGPVTFTATATGSGPPGTSLNAAASRTTLVQPN